MTAAYFEAQPEAGTPAERQRLWRRISGSLNLPGAPPSPVASLLWPPPHPAHPGRRPAGVLDNHAAELSGLVLSTLPAYDGRTQRAVLAALRVALGHEAFLRAFAAALVRAPEPRSRQEAFTLLCWSGAVLARLQLPDGRKAAARLAEAQARPGAARRRRLQASERRAPLNAVPRRPATSRRCWRRARGGTRCRPLPGSCTASPSCWTCTSPSSRPAVRARLLYSFGRLKRVAGRAAASVGALCDALRLARPGARPAGLPEPAAGAAGAAQGRLAGVPVRQGAPARTPAAARRAALAGAGAGATARRGRSWRPSSGRPRRLSTRTPRCWPR